VRRKDSPQAGPVLSEKGLDAGIEGVFVHATKDKSAIASPKSNWKELVVKGALERDFFKQQMKGGLLKWKSRSSTSESVHE
jgi:hypothetical protein